ncbi:MAG: glutathione S-transferase [Pseudomonadales bacterium]|jgi:glutathione S-transferase|nr:glutathione S-transferase [Pseudomonadales bacterium]
MALRYATIRCVMREVRLQDKPDALLAASPKGTVPVLLLPEQTLDESMAIVKWALAQNDPQGWCSEEPEVRVQMDQMIEDCEHRFKPHLDAYKYAPRSQGLNLQARDDALWFLRRLEQRLNSFAPRAYLFGNQLSLADVCIFPFVRQFAFVDKLWFDQCGYPALQQWLQMMLDSCLFNEVMKKYPQWQPQDAPIVG